MPAVWDASEPEFGEPLGELLGNVHDDVDVVGQELLTGGPEVDSHASDDHWMDPEWSGASLLVPDTSSVVGFSDDMWF